MRVILAGGGTGGHLFPGLAVAREFQARKANSTIMFVGTQQGIETRVIPAENFELELIPVKGLKGRGLRGWLDALYGVPAGLYRSLAIIRKFRPDLVIGLGGYASGPFLVAAKLRRLPCVIMEQNLRPGFTNRALARVVDRVFTSYRESGRYFPAARVVDTGNPVRWHKLPQVARTKTFTLLVFGGSAGARRLNMAAVEALAQLQDLGTKLRVIHQTGQSDFPSMQEAYAALPFERDIAAFIDKMDEAYAQADLVICRAGASTVAELTAYGKAAILVPYPYAIYDHQRWNAEALRERGAAEMILDRDLSGAALAERIRAYFADRERIQAMAAAARTLGRPDAAGRIVSECCALARARRSG